MQNDPEKLSDKDLREAAFWDQATKETATLDIDKPLSTLYAKHAQQLGDLHGKKVLDVGCGAGFWSLYMAKRGAQVWGIDISPGSIEVAKKNSVQAGLADRIEFSVNSALNLKFTDDFFDLVQGYDIIHHLDSALLGKEVARVLAPSGRIVFSENSANNPLLMFARNQICGRFGIAKWSSDDEYPLTRSAVRNFTQYFEKAQIEYPFIFLHYLDAKLFHYQNKTANRLCHAFDFFVDEHLPFVKQYSYRQIITCSSPKN